jgi:hypothetical protein
MGVWMGLYEAYFVRLIPEMRLSLIQV